MQGPFILAASQPTGAVSDPLTPSRRPPARRRRRWPGLPWGRAPLQHLPLTRRPAVLHHTVAVLDLAGRQGSVGDTAAPQRRRRQRLALAQRLLDPLPPALRPADLGDQRFWVALRWGGLGMAIAWWLARV